MEAMKKRSLEFRFDFNGHAVLYEDINPTGTRSGGAPSPGSSSGGGGPQREPKIESGKQPLGVANVLFYLLCQDH